MLWMARVMVKTLSFGAFFGLVFCTPAGHGVTMPESQMGGERRTRDILKIVAPDSARRARQRCAAVESLMFFCELSLNRWEARKTAAISAARWKYPAI
jgi:hypothetical protein